MEIKPVLLARETGDQGILSANHLRPIEIYEQPRLDTHRDAQEPAGDVAGPGSGDST